MKFLKSIFIFLIIFTHQSVFAQEANLNNLVQNAPDKVLTRFFPQGAIIVNEKISIFGNYLSSNLDDLIEFDETQEKFSEFIIPVDESSEAEKCIHSAYIALLTGNVFYAKMFNQTDEVFLDEFQELNKISFNDNTLSFQAFNPQLGDFTCGTERIDQPDYRQKSITLSNPSIRELYNYNDLLVSNLDYLDDHYILEISNNNRFERGTKYYIFASNPAEFEKLTECQELIEDNPGQMISIKYVYNHHTFVNGRKVQITGGTDYSCEIARNSFIRNW